MTTRRSAAPIRIPTADEAFVAIDFETADSQPDSACAVGLVRVERLQVVARESVLIRPPRSRIPFSFVHGITWEMVATELVFAEVWPRLSRMLDDVSFLAAHNASFDRRVLATCCAVAEIPAPPLPFLCTVQVARRHLGIRPANLPAVCRQLGISLKHHDAGSDAEACARILIAAATLLKDPTARLW